MTRSTSFGLEQLEQRVFLSASPHADSAVVDAAECGRPHVFAAGATVKGQTLGQWAASWWQWATSAPAAVNPLQDPTGEHAGVGQEGPVFFLAGRRGSGTVDRTITAPTGTKFFFPVLNTTFITFPEDPPATAGELRQLVGTAVDGYSGLYATIDGCPVDVSPHREVDPFPDGFELTLPEGNIFGRPAGVYGPVVTDGYWLMVSPLSPGDHTITFGGTFRPGRTLDVTYHVEVVPKGKYRKANDASAAAAPRAEGPFNFGRKVGDNSRLGAAAEVLSEAR